MQILHISAECYPVAKVGGLADVVGALPAYQNTIGHEAKVIMPFHKTAFVERASTKVVYCHDLVIYGKTYFSEILQLVDQELGFPVFMVRINQLTDRKNVYGYDDDPFRFLAFQRVVLQWVLEQEVLPDIVHCHDHHTGLIPFMMYYCFDFERLKEIPSVLSIHNAQYQGQFPHEMGGAFPRFRESDIGLLDWDGMINPLAAGIKCAWRVNTVSPSYMEEMKQKANGLEGLLAHEHAKCIGILNGIDTHTWNPETDTYLTKNYTIGNRVTGRRSNKKELCDEFGLDASKPLFGFIGRLVWEKGADILPDILIQALHQFDINIILLGSGFKEIEDRLKELAVRYPGRYNNHIGYEERMSHQVYAGADFLLMPSRVEPCGLNQMYALRYGCMPIVRATGGLKDTVIDIKDGGFGIRHEDVTVAQVVYSIGRAVAQYENQKQFKEIQKTMMHLDHSWDHSAGTYIKLYKELKE